MKYQELQIQTKQNAGFQMVPWSRETNRFAGEALAF